MGCSPSLSTSAEQAMRALPLIEHGAGAADLLQAVGVVGDGGGFWPSTGDGLGGDLAEQRGDVHARAVGDLEPLRAFAGASGVGLALDLNALMVRAAAVVVGVGMVAVAMVMLLLRRVSSVVAWCLARPRRRYSLRSLRSAGAALVLAGGEDGFLLPYRRAGGPSRPW